MDQTKGYAIIAQRQDRGLCLDPTGCGKRQCEHNGRHKHQQCPHCTGKGFTGHGSWLLLSRLLCRLGLLERVKTHTRDREREGERATHTHTRTHTRTHEGERLNGWCSRQAEGEQLDPYTTTKQKPTHGKVCLAMPGMARTIPMSESFTRTQPTTHRVAFAFPFCCLVFFVLVRNK